MDISQATFCLKEPRNFLKIQICSSVPSRNTGYTSTFKLETIKFQNLYFWHIFWFFFLWRCCFTVSVLKKIVITQWIKKYNIFLNHKVCNNAFNYINNIIFWSPSIRIVWKRKKFIKNLASNFAGILCSINF